MQRPKYGREYTFVRIEGDTVVEWVDFTAHADGTGGARLPVARNDDPWWEPMLRLDGCWAADLEWLGENGFVELGVARRDGRIPTDWKPPVLPRRPRPPSGE